MSKNSGLVWKTWSNLILLVGIGNPQGWHGHSHGLHCCEDVLENQFGIGASVFLRKSLSMDDPHLLDKCSFPALPRAYQQTTVRWVKNIRHEEAVYTKHVTGVQNWMIHDKNERKRSDVYFHQLTAGPHGTPWNVNNPVKNEAAERLRCLSRADKLKKPVAGCVA